VLVELETDGLSEGDNERLMLGLIDGEILCEYDGERLSLILGLRDGE
jgi:hypothetical protein